VTKSRESGQDHVTDDVRREAQRTGDDPCAILRRRLQEAKKKRDVAAIRQLQRAEKYFGCRNKRKRGRQRS
jgi:hypothetical protein